MAVAATPCSSLTTSRFDSVDAGSDWRALPVRGAQFAAIDRRMESSSGVVGFAPYQAAKFGIGSRVDSGRGVWIDGPALHMTPGFMLNEPKPPVANSPGSASHSGLRPAADSAAAKSDRDTSVQVPASPDFRKYAPLWLDPGLRARLRLVARPFAAHFHQLAGPPRRRRSSSAPLTPSKRSRWSCFSPRRILARRTDTASLRLA